MRHSRSAGVAFALLLTSCSGPMLEQDEGDSLVPAPATLYRLTQAQYVRSVEALFGSDIKVPSDLEPDTPLHGYSSVGASEITISPRAAEQYEAAALDLAHQVFADPARRAAFVGCTPKGLNDSCVRAFIERFGERAWRRPLVGEELDQLLGLVEQLGESFRSVWVGLEYAVAAILESPHFLFRVERGEPDPERHGWHRYTSFEMASRLSYFLTGSMPDEVLFEAARRGELVSEAGLRAQVERLLSQKASRAALLAFFNQYLYLDRLDAVSKDRKVFPQLTPTLLGSMRAEVERAIEDVVFDRDADFADLLSSGSTFVNAELAALYGLKPPPVEGFARVELPESTRRGGLMGMAALLSLNAHASVTSPTLRGKFIRQTLLCQDIPPPPPGVVTNLDASEGGAPMTMREKLRKHRESPACSGCHDRMDPIGLGLENFDALGIFRETENGLPIDAGADLDGTPFSGARQLGQALAAHPRLPGCVARQLYRHATAHLETEGELALIEQLGRRFAQGNRRILGLVLDIVLSDGFRYASVDRE